MRSADPITANIFELARENADENQKRFFDAWRKVLVPKGHPEQRRNHPNERKDDKQ